MVSTTIIFIFSLFFVVLIPQFHLSMASTWLRLGYWSSSSATITNSPVSEIDSTLFTHLISRSAAINSSSYTLFILPSDAQFVPNFTETVKLKNPSITTLLSIRCDVPNSADFSSTASDPSNRKSLIDSSIDYARLYGFDGLDLSCLPASPAEMGDAAQLFDEWRASILAEANGSNMSQLVLTASARFDLLLSVAGNESIVGSLNKNLDWVHIVSADYLVPSLNRSKTGAHDPLRDPNGGNGLDSRVQEWNSRSLAVNRFVIGLPFYGYAWTLVEPSNNGVGAPARGPAISVNGFVSYSDIIKYIGRYGAKISYSDDYTINYCSFGSTWIGFDDVEAVGAKVSYAMGKGFLGYFAWTITYDDNWVLSRAAFDAAAPARPGKHQGKLWLVITIAVAATIAIGLGIVMSCFIRKRTSTSNDKRREASGSMLVASERIPCIDFQGRNFGLTKYSLLEMESATNGFATENKLGQGGYGPVYKGVLSQGGEVAVKKLSNSSTQGYAEFENEVMLTAELQHVNLVRLIGFCTDKEEHMLVYEYMPNNSLDKYLFDPVRKLQLDWGKRVEIIEGVTQGLVYLQKYSRLRIIHRDLKPSNILLDSDMSPKISDLGLARIFAKDVEEANTERVFATLVSERRGLLCEIRCIQLWSSSFANNKWEDECCCLRRAKEYESSGLCL
ncbi:Class V chitinase [Linum grandiflorum]